MSSESSVCLAWFDFLPESVRDFLEGPAGIAVLVVVGAVAIFLLARFTGAIWVSMFGTVQTLPGEGLREVLKDYPPPPGNPGSQRVTVEGIPARVRLVVVAPMGKENPIHQEGIENLVDEVILGLKQVIQHDKPRMRLWPPQLSKLGFAPTFHREAERPEAEGLPSRWVLVAGLASAGRKPFLLGLALLADRPNTLGHITLDATRWAEVVRIVSD